MSIQQLSNYLKFLPLDFLYNPTIMGSKSSMSPARFEIFSDTDIEYDGDDTELPI